MMTLLYLYLYYWKIQNPKEMYPAKEQWLSVKSSKLKITKKKLKKELSKNRCDNTYVNSK